MKQLLAALGFCLFITGTSYSQTTIHCWSFNNGASSNTGEAWNSPVTTDARNTGSGTITHNFDFTEDFSGNAGNLCPGSSSAGTAFVAEDSTNNGSSLELEFSTKGYEDVELSFDVRRNSAGFNNVTVEYSINGGDTYTSLGSFDPTTSFNVVTYDLSSVPSDDDNNDFNIRITIDGASSESGNVRFDNISLEGTQLPSVDISISGTEGWRLISAPVSGVSFDDVIYSLWTQGFTGSDSPGNGTSNVYEYDETVTSGDLDSGFSTISDQSNTMSDAGGYAVYVFEDNDYDAEGIQEGFPKSLSVTGTAPSSDVGPISLTFTSSGTASSDGWNLVGNPFGTSINVDDLGFASESDLDNFAYVYRGGSYTALDASGSATTDTVAAGEGFFVKVGAAVSYTFPFAAANKQATSFDIREIAFTLNKGELSSQASIRFHEKADYGKESFDAYYLKSLEAKHIGFYSTDGEDKLSVNSYPFNIDGDLTTPFEISGTESGTFTLEWIAPSNFDDTWSLYLVDTVTDQTIDLNAEKSYAFEVEGIVDSRFNLIATQATSVNNEPGTDPTVFDLAQNYPNPFNPSTTINYSVPANGQVSLNVYNLMGQKVAQLVNEAKSAGSYEVSWDASGVASGMYIYRLEANGFISIKKMTLIK